MIKWIMNNLWDGEEDFKMYWKEMKLYLLGKEGK